MKREVKYLMLAAMGLMAGIWILMLVMRPRKDQWTCQSNLKQIGLAMMQYVRDYDEKLPPAHKWQTVFVPYLSGHMDPPQPPLECPSGWQYAMNGSLAGKSLGFINRPMSLPFAWDADTTHINTMDNGRLWPSPARHPNGNNVLFMDGHVAFRPQKPSFKVVILPTPTPTALPHPKTLSRLSLPPRVKQHSACHCHVERFGLTVHRNGDALGRLF